MSMEASADDRTDREVVRLVVDGDVDAFEVLVERYEHHVFKIVGAHVPPGDVAEVAQDVLVRTFRALPSFKGRSSLKHWLSRIASRTCSDYWRRRYRSKEIAANYATDEQKEWMQQVLDVQSVEQHERLVRKQSAKDLLRVTMRGLPGKERAALTMVALEGYTVQEAARKLEWSTTNTKVRLHRARKKLRSCIRELLENEGSRE